MPPKPATTCAGSVFIGAGDCVYAGTLAWTGTTGVAEDSVGVATPLVGRAGVLVDTFVAPATFSCVLPYADTPRTAPIAT